MQFGERAAWFARVLHDEAGDGQLLARGATWKAAFGRGGVTFVPRLPGAPCSRPFSLHFVALRVGGCEVQVARDAAARRTGDRVVFDRGGVREIYDLATDHVEQSFVVDTLLPGDVELELDVATDLVEDANEPGLQFRCPFGGVTYSEAFVVRGAERTAIATTFTGRSLRLRVPAELRGDGPLVIDPVLGTQTSSALGDNLRPDVAFDATNQRYLLVWENEFTLTDHDIISEIFDVTGQPIANTVRAIEIGLSDAKHPAVAALDDADRFLVVFDLADPQHGNRRMIYGRTREATGALTAGTYIPISNPALPGDNTHPDVGADSGTGAGDHDWLVVWNNQPAANDGDVMGRLIMASGQARTPVLPIESAGAIVHDSVQVSRSNGNGIVDHPQWLVVYLTHLAGNVSEVACHAVLPDGTVTGAVPLETTPARHLSPQVSSPLRDGSRATFLVTYARELPVLALGVVARFDSAWHGNHPVDLGQQFGVLANWQRPESDGARFVVASRGSTAQNVELRTLGWTGAGLVQQDLATAQSLEPSAVTACRASGGAAGLYAVAMLQTGLAGVAPRLLRYGGYQAGPMTTVRPTGCNGLAITGSPSSVLGATMQFALANYGASVPAFGFGSAAFVPVPICPACWLGLRLDLPIDLLLGDAFAITIPNDPLLVGQTFGVQGLGFGGGSCLGALSLSDTVQLTVR